MKKIIILILTFLTYSSAIDARRSRFRKPDPNCSSITLRMEGTRKSITDKSRYYGPNLFQNPNKDYYPKHFLPSGPITFANNAKKSVDSKKLNNFIEDLTKQVKKGKKRFRHFEIITTKNFNRRKRCGLIILKFKKYPFVVKLFIETPKTFIDYQSKGFENQFFFYMADGVNRHVIGVTRIKNLELIKKEINKHPRWKNRVTTPRKWFWLPKNAQWIQIDGKNIGEKKEISTILPSTYAIIADELDTSKDTTLLSSQEKNKLIMELCMDLHLFVDPHSDNFIVEYNKKNKDYHISIVDTEHFPSIVGLKEEPQFNNHLEWYIYLMGKCFQDMFLQTKQDRKNAQKQSSPLAVPW